MPKKSIAERAIAEALKGLHAATTPDPGPSPKPTNPKTADRRCCAAYDRAYKAKMAQGDGSAMSSYDSTVDAQEAFRDAMPMLAGYEGVRDFIACAAHGILINAIPQERTSHLLYAAQVALAALRHAPKTAPLPSRSTTTPTHPPTQKATIYLGHHLLGLRLLEALGCTSSLLSFAVFGGFGGNFHAARFLVEIRTRSALILKIAKAHREGWAFK
jgi:hypothetical protein